MRRMRIVILFLFVASAASRASSGATPPGEAAHSATIDLLQRLEMTEGTEKTGIHLQLSAPESELEIPEKIRHARQALVLARSQNSRQSEADHPSGIPMNREFLGAMAVKTGDYDSAVDYLDEALVLARQIDNRMRESAVLKSLGEAYIHLGEYANALNALNRCLKISREIGQNERIQEGYRLISDTYERLNEPEYALMYFRRYEVLKDSLFSEAQQSRIVVLQTRYETEKTSRENQALRMENTLHESLVKRQRLALIAALAFLILVFAIAILLVRGNKILSDSKKMLEEKSSELEKSNASKDKFFSIIAHDLRHPFNTIASFIRLMTEHADEFSKEDIREFVIQLQENADSTYNLLENLLQWACSQTGRIEFKPEKVRLSTLIERTVYALHQTTEAKDIRVVKNYTDTDCVFADHNMVSTVLRNLISNAVKFTPRGSRITITTRADGIKVITRVSDNGVGMEAETVNSLFQIDRRVKTEGTEGEVGSDLGLILCKEFIDLHEGKITVESRPGEGTQISFILPLCTPE